jgi:serine/threonine protein kinase/formylglycine-generating enzyme required for sulfatase activity
VNRTLAPELGRRIDEVCNRFEVAWRGDPPPRVEDFVAGWQGDERQELLRELVPLDADYRRARGHDCSPQDYLARFPDLDPAWVAEALSSQGARTPLAHKGPALPGHATPSAEGDADTTGPYGGSDPKAEETGPDVRPGRDAEGTPVEVGPGTLPPHQRFRILRPHARGGLGEVFVARDQELNREVALKEIQERHAGHPESRARFLLEAEVTGALEHPGIVPVYGLGRYADGRPFYAMRFVQGDSLKDAIDAFHQADRHGRSLSERSLALRQLLRRFLDVCNAIAYAHSRGVLHRDIKPANVMLGKFGETLVVDWGLAKVLDGAGAAAIEGPLVPKRGGDAAMTQAGAAMGTPAYMSPEQAAGRLDQLGPASDVYSLGATLYCLLTGQPPFAGGDVGAVLARVQRGDFPRPRQLNRRVPAVLEAVCLKAMANKPQDRYATSHELAEEIEHWLGDEPVRAFREPWTATVGRWVRRHQTPVAGVGALLLTGLIALGISTALVLRVKEREIAALRTRDEANLQHNVWGGGFGDGSLPVARDSSITLQRMLPAEPPKYTELLQQLAESARALRPLLKAEMEKTAAAGAPDAERQRLAFRQANAAVTLLHVGDADGVWPLLAHSSDPTRRTYLTHHLGPYGIPAAVLLDRLQVEKDVSARRALLLSLGEYPPEKVPADRRQEWVSRLVQDYRNDPDPGIHAAIEWLLRQWHEDARLPKLKDYRPTVTNKWSPTWHVNGQGQTLTVIPRPEEFQMGSPEPEPRSEAGRTAAEKPHWRKIPRSYAIAAKEVTVAEFRQFLRDNPAIEKEFAADGWLAVKLEQHSPADDGPIITVDWYSAAAYCNWLSRQEGLPEAEWCYPGGPGQIRPGMVLPDGYLRRKGYRLPTEAEWEYACRAGTVTSRYFGRAEALLGRYAWYDQNAEGRARPAGRLRPNDLGLFDMLGNAAEWCQDRVGDYPKEAMKGPVADGEDPDRRDAASRVVRGGSFAHLASLASSARRDGNPPAERSIRVGLRVARTCDGPP